ncbi:MAG: hypothetical protein E7259_07875 [Lachnospiraceae bacterium]|nr:hypothetical protein [Lachnospiraceae bacterium]
MFATIYFIIGALSIVVGIITLRFPEWGWKLSLKRYLYVENGEPSPFYYAMAKIGGVLTIIIGVVLIIMGFGRIISEKKGFIISIDNQEISLPCAYEDFESIGFTACEAGDLNVQISDKDITIKLKNSKGQYIKVTFKNPDGVARPLTDSQIYGVSATYQTKSFETSFTGDDPTDMNSYDIVETVTDVDPGPMICLPNGFDTSMNKTSTLSAMGDGGNSFFGTSKTFSVKQHSEIASVQVNFTSDGTNITYVSIDRIAYK